ISPSLKRPSSALPSGTSRWRQMLSAKIGFAVPEKILNRSSFTALVLQCDRSAIAHAQTSLTWGRFYERDRHEETLRLDPRSVRRLTCVAHQTSVPVARDRLANEGLIVRKPCSGSARQRWARENSKHRRTATRQRGFCSSSLEQLLLDAIKPGMPPENRPLEIIRKAASLRAPAQSTEL